MSLRDVQLNFQRRLRTYTVREVCKILKFDKKKVYALLQSGELRGKKTADAKTGRWRVSEQEILNYLSNKETGIRGEDPVRPEVGYDPGY
ncbi:MAG: hypothetical protein CL755_12575 [Chloroflexi bacterium]|nr:hypothetical protein [Chloroflexota bacterium]